jgi:hypothetical protein
MKKKPYHKEIRVIDSYRIIPYSLGSYKTGWFEKVKIKQMYLEYDSSFGVWADCCFVDEEGEDMDSVMPRNYRRIPGRNPHPWNLRPTPPPAPPPAMSFPSAPPAPPPMRITQGGKTWDR